MNIKIISNEIQDYKNEITKLKNIIVINNLINNKYIYLNL